MLTSTGVRILSFASLSLNSRTAPPAPSIRMLSGTNFGARPSSPRAPEARSWVKAPTGAPVAASLKELSSVGTTVMIFALAMP